MKKLVLLLSIAFVMPTLVWTQIKWDTSKALYTNATYGFTWQLPTEYSWEQTTIYAKHTVAKFKSDENIAVYLNIGEKVKGPYDLWDYFKEYKQVLDENNVYLSQQLGEKVDVILYSKYMFKGKKAIKYFSKWTLNGKVEYQLSIYFYQDTSLWTISADFPSEAFEKFGLDKIIDDVILGFNLNQ